MNSLDLYLIETWQHIKNPTELDIVELQCAFKDDDDYQLLIDELYESETALELMKAIVDMDADAIKAKQFELERLADNNLFAAADERLQSVDMDEYREDCRQEQRISDYQGCL